MTLETLALFAATEFLLSLTPGPAVMLVVGLSMRQGARAGHFVSLGVLLANAFYFALSALGVGALILTSAALFTALKWIGAAYLAWLGARMAWPLLRRLWRERGAGTPETGLDLDAASRAAPANVHGAWALVGRGFVLQCSNPKNLAFFVAILPQFVSPGEPVAWQMLLLGLVSVAVEWPILVAYSFAAAASARAMRGRIVEWIEGVAGGVLVALGAALASSRTP